MKKKMTRTNVYLTNKQHSQIGKEANKKEITFSEMLRRIVDYWYDKK